MNDGNARAIFSPEFNRHRKNKVSPMFEAFDSGKSHALRTMLRAETERRPDFLRLANALSARFAGCPLAKR